MLPSNATLQRAQEALGSFHLSVERKSMRMVVLGAALRVICALALGATSAGASEFPQIPSAIFEDPPVSAKYPASGAGVRFPSQGVLINAQLYRPSGEGAHPTVILLHGLPGNEQNLDLARAIQRSGWTVITFHYRGSWGSPGTFTLLGGVADAAALVAWLQHPEHATAWGVDPARIVMVGHSYGGYIAARVAAARPSILAAALIAPWDISYDAREWSAFSARQLFKVGADNFDDVDGRLSGATASSLTRDVLRDGPSLNLTALSAGLAKRRILIITATRDDPDDQASALVTNLKRRSHGTFESEVMMTDHGFNDHRIALEVAVVSWLARLPGAPPKW